MMKSLVPFEIAPQPDEITCGPTCLHAIYRFYQDPISLEQTIAEVSMLEEGGTLAVLLACHALERGYRATIYTYKLQLFDPTWASLSPTALAEKLKAQARYKPDEKLRIATSAYLQFLELGGELRAKDLNGRLLRAFLNQGTPIITGLSATYLYRSPREYGPKCDYDDIRGEPSGHFVVLHGYDQQQRLVHVADPLQSNPLTGSRKYEASMDRVINAILLGVLTYDANLLIIQPARGKQNAQTHPDRRR
ncbi:C39 family peptidase [Desulfobulbus alkaliphilus]|uniref:C39 family peptidase n=1 Tax=Desulfobulbus alkaliphilus TaxID=869814 RepID=UPI001963E2DD|nr:C39 family peptidase [Desulfobulbus alkaliphilus]MBM9537549.1 C39 family peptidase [Desulfobulbus alkaliphilus]